MADRQGAVDRRAGRRTLFDVDGKVQAAVVLVISVFLCFFQSIVDGANGITLICPQYFEAEVRSR